MPEPVDTRTIAIVPMAAMEGDDGWDDDDDLGLDGLSSEDENEKICYAVRKVPPPEQKDNDSKIPATVEASAAASKVGPIKTADSSKVTRDTTCVTLRGHEKLIDGVPAASIGPSMTHEEKEKEEVEESGKTKVEDEDWDFDEDDDIFSEGNTSLVAEDAAQEESPVLALTPIVSPLPPVSHANKDAATLESIHSNGNADENNLSVASCTRDGWSDEDFFEDVSTSAKPSKISPPPHPKAIALATSSTEPSSKVASGVTIGSVPLHQVAQTTLVAQNPPLSQPSKLLPPKAQFTASNDVRTMPSLNPTQRKVNQMLFDYLSALHDTSNFVMRLHQKLHLCQQQQQMAASSNIYSNNTDSAASNLTAYYATRPGLRKYTLGLELDRMDYRLVLVNGKSTSDKDVIRSYFGVGEDGENQLHSSDKDVEEAAGEGEMSMTEELLIRSANQSLLADMLVALTAYDDCVCRAENCEIDHLILSGPTLCMTSVAESCHFTVDLQCGKVEAVCSLAISVPFHPKKDDERLLAATADAKDGRLILARAEVSVRFRPGSKHRGSCCNDELYYTVRSVDPLHNPESVLVRAAAISLANDIVGQDPSFHHGRDERFESDGPTDNRSRDNDDGVDARDRFLLRHHLLSSADSAALLIVSKDRINKLKGAAEKSSTGFRSALRQLDGVTNVSAKLGGLTGGFSLMLPRVEEIQAAEREASVGGADPPKNLTESCFPRPHLDVVNEDGPSKRPPMPSLPDSLPQAEVYPSSSTRPRPIIGGFFMSGLSRLAAAATQPADEQKDRISVEDTVGSGNMTHPCSILNVDAQINKSEPGLNQREFENEGSLPSLGGAVEETVNENSSRRFTGLTPLAAANPSASEQRTDCSAGWSDDEFNVELDFDESAENHYTKSNIEKRSDKNETKIKNKIVETNDSKEEIAISNFRAVQQSNPVPREPARVQHQHTEMPISTVSAMPPCLPTSPKCKQQGTFEEEFIIVLKEHISLEIQEMKDTGRMKRWTPLREDAVRRKRLMEVMTSSLKAAS